MHFENEGVCAALEDVCLADRIFQVLVFYKERLVEYLHGHSVLDWIRIVFKVNLEDFSK